MALFAWLALWALGMGTAHAAPVKVLVSILPQQYFAEQIGGDLVDVTVVVGPGRSPENYEPSLQQMHALSGARLYWRIGLPFESHLGLEDIARNSQLLVLDARQGIVMREMESLSMVLADDHHDSHATPRHDHGHQGLDPHYWLDPNNVKAMAQAFKAALVEIDPEHSAAYEANFLRFTKELEQLDTSLHAQLDSLQQRRFMVFHPAWGYFAAAYNLRQVPIEIEGKSPGPKTLAAIIQLARREHIRVIFVQQQFSQRDAQTVAQAITGRVVVVDPLALDYSDNLRRVAQAFAEAMQ